MASTRAWPPSSRSGRALGRRCDHALQLGAGLIELGRRLVLHERQRERRPGTKRLGGRTGRQGPGLGRPDDHDDPIIPWINNAAATNCSFPTSVYGAQQSVNPYVTLPGGGQCGNGLTTSGATIADTDIASNNQANSPAFERSGCSTSWTSTARPPRVAWASTRWTTSRRGGTTPTATSTPPRRAGTSWSGSPSNTPLPSSRSTRQPRSTVPATSAGRPTSTPGRPATTSEPRRQHLGGAVLPPAARPLPEAARDEAARLLRRALLPDYPVGLAEPERLHRPVRGG